MSNNAPLNLDELVNPVGSVVLKDVTYDVMPLDGFAYHAVQRLMKEGGSGDLTQMYDIAARVLPGCPREVIDTMTAVQVGKLVQLAGAPAERVHATIPKTGRARNMRAHGGSSR